MNYRIQKGDEFLCLENYVMYDDNIAYTKGYTYYSDFDECITDNQKDPKHQMDGQEDFFEYFKYISKI